MSHQQDLDKKQACVDAKKKDIELEDDQHAEQTSRFQEELSQLADRCPQFLIIILYTCTCTLNIMLTLSIHLLQSCSLLHVVYRAVTCRSCVRVVV